MFRELLLGPYFHKFPDVAAALSGHHHIGLSGEEGQPTWLAGTFSQASTQSPTPEPHPAPAPAPPAHPLPVIHDGQHHRQRAQGFRSLKGSPQHGHGAAVGVAR